MALPTLDKVWVFPAVSTTGGGVSGPADHRELLHGIKTAFNAAASPWTVAGSSNSTVGAMDAVDRLAAAANWIWDAAGTAHSWIVLTSVAGAQICIDCTPLASTVQGPFLTVAYSPGKAFAGGSNINRPVAADEIILLNGVQWCGTDSTTGAFNFVYHVMRSNDGAADRVVIHNNKVPVGFWLLDNVAQQPVVGWATPRVCAVIGGLNLTTPVTTYSKLWALAPAKALVGATTCNVYFTSDGWGGQGAGQRLTVANDITSEWPMFSIAFASQTINGRGRLTGQSPTHRGCWDLWFGSITPGEGDTYPAGGSNEFVQFGHLIFPWDGSVPVTA